jgi:hypothetical protein
MGGACAYNILVERPEGRRPLGRPRCRWKDNIKVDLWILGKQGLGMWIGFMWLGVGICGGLL